MISFTEGECQNIKRTNFHGKTDVQKFMQMVALFELEYDVAIRPRKHVLGNPGFEGCGLMKLEW